jgi:hypothetical protein
MDVAGGFYHDEGTPNHHDDSSPMNLDVDAMRISYSVSLEVPGGEARRCKVAGEA